MHRIGAGGRASELNLRGYLLQLYHVDLLDIPTTAVPVVQEFRTKFTVLKYMYLGIDQYLKYLREFLKVLKLYFEELL